MNDRSYIDQQDYITASIGQEVAVERLIRARAENAPHMRYRPKLFLDGDTWCALFGEDIQSGVSGWGRTPDEAMKAFDLAWVEPYGEAGVKSPSGDATAVLDNAPLNVDQLVNGNG